MKKIGIAAACALLVALFPAAASATWSGAARLTPDNYENDAALPRIATDAAGDAIAAWFQKGPTTGGLNGVAYATGTALGTWTPQGYISGSGEAVVTGTAWPVVLAEAPTGQAVLGWTVGSNHALVATQRTTTAGPFATPAAITGNGVTCANNVNLTDDDVVYPSAGLGADGNGWISWHAGCGNTEFGRRAYVRALQSGTFGVPRDAGTMEPDGGSVVGPALGVSPTTGAGFIAFSPEASSPLPLETRSLSFTSGLGAPELVVSGGRQPSVAVGPSDQRIVASIVGGDGVYVREGQGGAVRVSPEGQSPAGAYPQIAAAADGTLVVAWRDIEGAVWAAVRHGGTWGAPQQLSDPEAEAVHVAIAADDVAYVTWQRDISQFTGIEASVMDPGDPTRSPGAPWSFQPTPEVVANAAEGSLPSILQADVTGSDLTVRPDGVALIALTWRNSLSGSGTHVAGVIQSSAPVGIGGTATGEAAGGGSGSGSTGTAAAPAKSAGPDTRPPTLSVFSASRTFFATGNKLGKKVAEPGDKTVIANGMPKSGLLVGTTFKWTQDEAGKARLTITYEGCSTVLARTSINGYTLCSKKDKDGKVVFTKTVTARRGANDLDYLGTAKAGKIKSGGSYTAKLVALDASGNASKPKTLRFQIDAPTGK